jgi:hypothetical protein
MFKRANKVTALLVAAASIMSVVPAMAADTTRLGNKDGTVKQAIAFGDGSYSYYGYRTDDDDTGIYYNNDGGATKEKLDSDLEDYRYNNDSKYGTKYAYAKENSNDDEYLIDLSTGKIVDDETVEEKADNAKSKFVSKAKKADRYQDALSKSSDIQSIFDSAYNTAGANKFTQILPGQFGEVYYKFEVTTGASITYKDVAGQTTSSAVNYIGFTSDTGSYVDLTKETNIRIFSSKTGRAEYIKQYGEEDKDAKLKVDLINVEAIAQDADYIYTLTRVAVTDTNNTTLYNTAALPQEQLFIQKVSKAQGSKDDDEAYTAKSIDSYQLQAPNAGGSVNEIYNEGDFTAAYDKLIGSDATEKLLGVVVKDSTLYIYAAKLNGDADFSDKLQVWKLKLGKFKKDVKIGGVTLKKDVDTNAVKKDGDTDDGDVIDFALDSSVAEDQGLQGLELVAKDSKYGDIQIAGRDLYKLPSVSIDTTGNVWAIEKGKVIKYSGTDKSTVYTVDRAMNAIDAYDEKNIIVWDVTGDVYTNISEGHKTTVNDGIAVDPTVGVTTPATVGWVKDATTGGWSFYDVNGVKTANYWANDNGTWYWIKADGVMATGWVQVAGTWYFLAGSGAMQTGWLNDNGTWYYLASSGAMLANTTVDGYVLGASGAWIK